ncbi:hypothetical protein BC833DRAFT_607849 [Globomyces pollinis-pini]|nr:hypothetical protein BC833DRAFT_607849 [Globomyces pollinis-pini]
MSTTDYQCLYCYRNFETGTPLSGHRHQYHNCVKFFRGKFVEQHVIQQGKAKPETDDPDAKYAIVSKKIFPGYFNSLGIDGVWDLLGDAQPRLNVTDYIDNVRPIKRNYSVYNNMEMSVLGNIYSLDIQQSCVWE